jgi:hypothetical protein
MFAVVNENIRHILKVLRLATTSCIANHQALAERSEAQDLPGHGVQLFAASIVLLTESVDLTF